MSPSEQTGQEQTVNPQRIPAPGAVQGLTVPSMAWSESDLLATYLHILCAKKPSGAHVGTFPSLGIWRSPRCDPLHPDISSTPTPRTPQNCHLGVGAASAARARRVKPSILAGASWHGHSSRPCKGCLRTLAPLSQGEVSYSRGRAKGCSLSHIPLPPLLLMGPEFGVTRASCPI